MSERKLPTIGVPNGRFANLGVWTFCLGPGSPVPGERLKLGILDQEGNVVRRFEQIEGRCLDEGYVDFFLGPNCRPARYERPLVDIDIDNQVMHVLHPDFSPRCGMGVYLELVRQWAEQYGRPEYAL